MKSKILLGSFFILVVFTHCATKKKSNEYQNSGFTKGINVKMDLKTKEIIGAEISIRGVDDKTIYWADTLKKNNLNFNLNLPEKGFYVLNFKGKYPQNKIVTGWVHDIKLYLEDDRTYQVLAGDDQTILFNRSKVLSDSKIQSELSLYEETLASKQDSLFKELKKKELFVSDSLFNHSAENYKQAWSDYLKDKQYLQQEFPNESIREFALAHPNSIISPYELINVSDIQEKYDLYKDIYDSLSALVKWNEYAILFKKKLDAVKILVHGNKVPEVAGKGLNNEDFNYDYSKNKLTLIEFWASWCKPCRDEHPYMVKLYQEYHDKGFDIISVSMDQDRGLWEAAIKQDKLNWKNHFSDLQLFDKSSNATRFNIGFVPSNYFIDSNGNIITKNIELDSLEKVLRKIK